MNNEHSAMLLNQLSNNAAIEQDITLSIMTEKADYNLVSLLKPTVCRDGNQWCVLYGINPQEGVAGFGDTPYKAVLAFNKNWNK